MQWIRRLEYPRVQTYAIPYITEIFYAISAVIIVLLATLNVAIAGNDVVTVLKDSPNNTDTKWWAPKWMPDSLTFPTVPGPCQPLNLPTSIRTNSTLPIFEYTLLNGLGTGSDGRPKWFDSVKYSAEPLQNCEVQNMTMLINFQDRGHQLTTQVVCDINSKNDTETPPRLKFSTTFSRMANTDLGQDDVVDYISSYVVPTFSDIKDARSVLLANNSTALNMLGVLDAFGSELLKMLWARKWTWKIAGNESWPDQAVVKWSTNPECWRAESVSWCRRDGLETSGIMGWYSNTKGSQDYSPSYLIPMNTTLFNYFVAMRDAVHLDMGNVNRSTNIYLSRPSFQERIRHDPFMSDTAPLVINQTHPDGTPNYTDSQFWRTCSWGWGCINGTWTDAMLNDSQNQNITKGLPLKVLEEGKPQDATVIDVRYVCPVFRLKRTGSLLLSVFIGTFSMYTALYGMFLFVAPKIDEWFRKRRGLRRFDMDLDHLGPYSSIVGPFPYQETPPPHSSNPYNTVFDATEMYQYNEAAPRYDSNPAVYPYAFQTPGSANRKGSLPPGAYLPTQHPASTSGPASHSNNPYHQAYPYIPPIPSTSTLTLGRVPSRRSVVTTPLEDDSEQDALLPGVFEPTEHNIPSTSGNSARTIDPEDVVYVPARSEHAVSVVEGARASGIRLSDSFKATVVEETRRS